MSGEWIKVRTNLWDDPRVSRLVDATSSTEATVVGGLYWLWATADQHSSDGVLTGMTLRGIDRKTGVQGLGSALVSIGWLIDNGESVTVSRFEDHNGASAKARAQTARRVAHHKGNAKVTPDALPTSQDSVIEALPRRREEEEEEEELTSKASTPTGVDVASNAGNVLAKVPVKPDCPHQEIIALYHEVLPQCPQVRDWTSARQTQLRARWNESPDRQNLDYWRRFFEYVKSCPFLIGASAVAPGRKPFIADLEWLTKSANFTKVREQRYEQ